LSVGLVPYSSVDFDAGHKRYEPAFVQTFGVDFDAGLFHIFTTMEVRETKSGSVYFSPFRADFLIGGELCYRGFFAGLVHECNHDVVIWGELRPNNGWDAAWTTAHAGWKGEFEPHEQVLFQPSLSAGLYLDDAAEIKFIDNFTKYEKDRQGRSVADGIIFARAGASAALFRALTGSLSVQGEFVPESGWSRLKCDAGLEVHYRGLGMGAAWMGQKRLDTESYAVNEVRFYLVLRGQSPLF
jgi:hypothetical protein